MTRPEIPELSPHTRGKAFRFVLTMGMVSLFADWAYEGARSITGPFLAALGANGLIVGIVAGFGELAGYGLRLASGYISEKTEKFWPITLAGYFVQMAAVPLLAFAGSWQAAALLIVFERMGKAIRTPPKSVMLSHAGEVIGQGWVFGLNEGLDQLGACAGPLMVAWVLAGKGDPKTAFLMLLIPAALTLLMVAAARLLYPRPEDLHAKKAPDLHGEGLPRAFWIYLAGAALVGAGFPDFALMSYHWGKNGTVSPTLIPICYALAMGASGLGSLVFGRLFDSRGIRILIPVTIVTVFSVPLAFQGGESAAFLAAVLWGLGMGVHDSIIPAAVAGMAPLQRRASAYGIFTAGYGVAWFLGSAILGMLYDVSLPALIGFSFVTTCAAVFFLLRVTKT
jgi:predicted MFS family arabinose efflux permease